MKRVLVLYTGGTLGCTGEPLRPMAGEDFAALLCARGLLPAGAELLALEPVRDSASMQPTDWLEIAGALLARWEDFDGFVVLHGTDTLAWTAAALSFLLAGQDKPVVLTGAQRPLLAADSDGPGNLLGALAAASDDSLCEVAVAFGGYLLRGRQVSKCSAEGDAAFASPRWPALGRWRQAGWDRDLSASRPHGGPPFSPVECRARLAGLRSKIGACFVPVFWLHPGFPASLLDAGLALPGRVAWLLACFGTGNAPEDPALLGRLAAARDHGIAVLAITQAARGMVRHSPYQSATGLRAVGVLDGGALGLEAAQAWLWLALAAGLSGPALATELALVNAEAGVSA